MTVIEKEKVLERPAPEAPVEPKTPTRIGAVIWALAVIAMAAVAAVVVLMVTGGEETTGAAPGPDYRSEQQILADLANQGYIPAAAVDWQLLKTERLVEQGLVPGEALEPASGPTDPLYTPDELLMIDLANTGQIPMEAVDWDEVALKKLVNQGLLPRAALGD